MRGFIFNFIGFNFKHNIYLSTIIIIVKYVIITEERMVRQNGGAGKRVSIPIFIVESEKY